MTTPAPEPIFSARQAVLEDARAEALALVERELDVELIPALPAPSREFADFVNRVMGEVAVGVGF